jgi:hypothetical protein
MASSLTLTFNVFDFLKSRRLMALALHFNIASWLARSGFGLGFRLVFRDPFMKQQEIP